MGCFCGESRSIPQIYVRPFPGLQPRVQVSLDGGTTPLWSRDGKHLLYVAGHRVIDAALGAGPAFTVLSRTTMLDRNYTFGSIHADYDILPDGKSLLVLRPTIGVLNAALHGRYRHQKVLRPELAAVVGAERFLAEVKTTADGSPRRYHGSSFRAGLRFTRNHASYVI